MGLLSQTHCSHVVIIIYFWTLHFQAYSSIVSIIVEELEKMIGGNPFQDKYWTMARNGMKSIFTYGIV